MKLFQSALSLLLLVCLLFSLAACGSKKPVTEPTQADKEQATEILHKKRFCLSAVLFPITAEQFVPPVTPPQVRIMQIMPRKNGRMTTVSFISYAKPMGLM